MNIEDFIAGNDVDYTKNIITANGIKEAEKAVGVPFGSELKKYLSTWGYLGFLSIEFYGINSRQNLESDMISQTIYLHKYFPDICEYIAFENVGDGQYALVDKQDNIYLFDTEEHVIIDQHKTLFQYILDRFSEEN